ncbi:MAG: MBL fold metallo-hydrolase, partial [Myxococcota bacterium]
QSTARWPGHLGPGIYRREHASLLICSETTAIAVDPIGLELSLPGIADAPLDTVHPITGAPTGVDAVVITHSHDDHFHLPSLLRSVAADCPVLVPEVPRPSLLTRVDLAAALAALGQRVVSMPWYTTHTVGDITIEAVPFYGEQPTRLAPGPPPDMRNWGNCYRITTPQLSALILVDSGCDPLGDMVEVARRCRREHGPVDIALSCLRSFASPFFGGLPYYWAALPLDQLGQLWRQLGRDALPATTAGAIGTAAVCAAAGARYFLPYAHGFAGVGQAIDDVGWGAGEPAEHALLAELSQLLSERGATTEVRSWQPGQCARLVAGQLRIDMP